MSFSGPRGRAFEGDKNGRLYLTTHRMAFTNKNNQDEMKSFSFPFVALRNVELEQPVFGANYIKGKILAQPNGGMHWFQSSRPCHYADTVPGYKSWTLGPLALNEAKLP